MANRERQDLLESNRKEEMPNDVRDFLDSFNLI
jgi:hypothetical protein